MRAEEEHVIMSDIPLKRCTKCGEEKPATPEFFHRDKYAKDGLKTRCKVCEVQQVREWKSKNPEKIREYKNRPEVKAQSRAWQQAHHSELKEYHRAYGQKYEARPEVKARRHAQRNRPERKAQQRAYRQAHRSRPEVQKQRHDYAQEYYGRSGKKEHRRAYWQEYYSRPGKKEHYRAYWQEYYSQPEKKEHHNTRLQEHYSHPEVKERRRIQRQAHRSRPEVQKQRHALWQEYYNRPEAKELHHARTHRRRAHERAAEGHFTAQDIQNLLKGQRGKCAECKKKLEKYHIDHIIPLTRGGSNWPHNLQLLCPPCNLSKGNKLPHEFDGSGQMRLLS
jgi:5-methylcytosine-specific restriction endonuclease McrA